MKAYTYDEETYAAYLERLERKEQSQRHTGSARWQESEMNKLEGMLTSGATQLEIAAALPYRSWQAIRRRVILLRGPGFVIPESGYLEDGETYEAYLSRDSSVAETMAFQDGGSLERQISLSVQCHRSGGSTSPFNIAVLLANSSFCAVNKKSSIQVTTDGSKTTSG
jgi:hypothetical protein